jgi:hypothetical protein
LRQKSILFIKKPQQKKISFSKTRTNPLYKNPKRLNIKQFTPKSALNWLTCNQIVFFSPQVISPGVGKPGREESV